MKRLMFMLIFLIILSGCTKKEAYQYLDEGEGVALINAYIIDGTGHEPIENGVVVFKDGIIEAVGSTNEITIPNGYDQYDMKGNTVMPGFINAHVHQVYNEKQLQKFLKAGVTTVRALSNSGVTDFINQKNMLNENILNAKIIQSTPIITTPGGYGSVFADSVEDAEQIVEGYIDQGVDIIKFSIEDFCANRKWTLMDQDKINAIVNTAHAHNKRVAVHVTWNRCLKMALAANVDEISHMVIDHIPQEVFEQAVEQGVYWIPTLELWRAVKFLHSVGYDTVAINNLKKFYELGGKVAFGTDYAGYNWQFDNGFPITEVKLMMQAGMTVHDIIISATHHAAIVCDRIDTLGTLEVGKMADIFVVKGSPFEDINAFTNPFMVIHQGQVIIR